METDDVEGFLQAAEEGAKGGAYGKHGLRAFMAAHNDNCTIMRTGENWCFASWEEYSTILDRQDQADARFREHRRKS